MGGVLALSANSVLICNKLSLRSLIFIKLECVNHFLRNAYASIHATYTNNSNSNNTNSFLHLLSVCLFRLTTLTSGMILAGLSLADSR